MQLKIYQIDAFTTKTFEGNTPKAEVDEDPVTGSAFTQLVGYWADVLGKEKLHAKQVSLRGGEVHCVVKDDRVEISGGGVLYLAGVIEV